MRRIVVTGMGAVSPLGCGVELSWRRLLAGQSGLRPLPAWAQTLPARIAGLVPDKADDAEGGFDPAQAAAPKDQRKMDRFILFALLATARPWRRPNGRRRTRARWNGPRRSSAPASAAFRRWRRRCASPSIAARAGCRRSRSPRSSPISPPVTSRSNTASRARWARPSRPVPPACRRSAMARA